MGVTEELDFTIIREESRLEVRDMGTFDPGVQKYLAWRQGYPIFVAELILLRLVRAENW
jgi:hypothetical protein